MALATQVTQFLYAKEDTYPHLSRFTNLMPIHNNQ